MNEDLKRLRCKNWNAFRGVLCMKTLFFYEGDIKNIDTQISIKCPSCKNITKVGNKIEL